MIKVFAGVVPWMSISILRPSFTKGQASSCQMQMQMQKKSLIL